MSLVKDNPDYFSCGPAWNYEKCIKRPSPIQFGTQVRKCLQFEWHFNSGPWRQDVLYGPAENFALCRLRPSQNSRAVGRQPAIPRSLEYRTILYKTTFALDNYEDTFLTKIMNCKGTCSLSTFSMEKPGLG